MTQYLIMCRSLTQAQRAARLLERAGVTATLVKAPQSLSGSGCGYAVSLHRKFETAVNVLKMSNISYGKVYFHGEDGEYTEIRI